MKRPVPALLALAAAAALAGCGNGGTPTRSVVVYWDFLRHTQTAQGDVPYDTNVNVGGGNGVCQESGVETITITNEAGQVVNPELPDVPCVYQGVQGVQVNGIRRGSHTWTLTGYRGTGTNRVATFLSTFAFNDATSGVNGFTARLEGIRDDLDLFVLFTDPVGTPFNPQPLCAQLGPTTTLGYSLVDFVGTTVATGTIPCTDPAGVFFRNANGRGIDRETYTLRLQAYEAGGRPLFDTAAPALRPTACLLQPIDHLGSDVGNVGFDVKAYDVQNSANGFCG